MHLPSYSGRALGGPLIGRDPNVKMKHFSRRTACEQLVLLTLGSIGVGACKGAESNAAEGEQPPHPYAVRLSQLMLAGATHPAPSGFRLPYRLFVPKDYDASRRFPLVLFLHPAGGRGNDNIRQLSQGVNEWLSRAQQIEPAFILAPHCPRQRQWVSAVRGRPFKNYDQRQVPENEQALLARQAVKDVCAQYSIDPERRYIVGASMGAVGAWDFITRHPGEFAAAIACTGVNDPRRAPVIARLPIWAFHGALDQTNPVENTREMVQALREVGSTVRYTEYPDVGHYCWEPAFADDNLYRWVFAQRLGRPDPWAS